MKNPFLPALVASLITLSTQAQEMPAPHRMPRVPVSRETLVEPRDPMPVSRQIQGPAAIIDGEKLRIGEADIRLFGVVPPQLAASFGPQARSALDQLANGQTVACDIRDRDRDGRLLATCRNAAGNDMALELLRHGLAVAARGSLAGTELAAPYQAAEAAAQNQKIGLWSVAIPAAALPVAAPAPKTETIVPPVTAEAKKEKTETQSNETKANDTQAKIAADIIGQRAQSQIDEAAYAANGDEGFFERYQILIAGCLMLLTALCILGALWAQKRRDRRDEIKAIAAALRGELMAARGVCFGRAKTIMTDEDDRAAIWPRIRATLYQAYVARLGLLGAELARQIASIYGQASDYAALYNPPATANASPLADAPKKQALETLLRHIDEVLPRLASIEQSGAIPATTPYTYRAARSRYDMPTLPRSNPAPLAALNAPATPIVKKPEVIEGAVTPVDHETPQPATDANAETQSAPPAPTASAQAVAAAARAPVQLWEAVRGFIQNHRNAIAANAPLIHDPHSADYAEIIEAEIAKYQYGNDTDAYGAPTKKSG